MRVTCKYFVTYNRQFISMINTGTPKNVGGQPAVQMCTAG